MSENHRYQLLVSLDYPPGLSLQSLTKYLRLNYMKSLIADLFQFSSVIDEIFI